MFRPLRRKSRAISDEAARELLGNGRRAVLAVNGGDGYPFAFPINYFYDTDSDRIYFHGSKRGYKVDALKQCDKICLTVYGNEHYKDDDWAPYVQSTIAYGRCRLIDDPEITEARVRELAGKYYPNESEIEAEFAAGIRGVQLFEIEIEHLCGKQIQEK